MTTQHIVSVEDADHGCRHCRNTGFVSYPTGGGVTTHEPCHYCSTYARKRAAEAARPTE